MFDRQTIVTALILALGSSASADPAPAVPFPEGYRAWPVTRTMLIGPGSKDFEKSGGLHHYYANEQAMEGFRSGKFPRGAIIVDERLQTREVDGVTLEGELRGVAVMMKDADRYRDTGGWGFERFAGDDRTAGVAAGLRARCFACHSKAKDSDFVFSKPRT